MRHPLFLIAAMLLAGASAMAQTTHFALAYDSDNSTVVYTDDGRRFDLDGRVYTYPIGTFAIDNEAVIAKGSSLAAPQKVYTFRLNESAESYKLAISRY